VGVGVGDGKLIVTAGRARCRDDCVIRPFSVLCTEHLGLKDDIEKVLHRINATIRRRLPW
jgi:hypothetical protein